MMRQSPKFTKPILDLDRYDKLRSTPGLPVSCLPKLKFHEYYSPKKANTARPRVSLKPPVDSRQLLEFIKQARRKVHII